MRLAGSNLDGSAKIRPTPKKEMTAAEIAELTKLLDEAFKKDTLQRPKRKLLVRLLALLQLD